MLSYLLKLLSLVVFAFSIIYIYYFKFPFHIENFDGYSSYVITIIFFYSFYKYFQIDKGGDKVIFTPFKILLYFLLHLLVLCLLYFSLNSAPIGDGIILFFRVIFFSIFPILITFITISAGKKILKYLPNIEKDNKIFNFVISSGLGFSVFIFLISIFGLLGFYNIGTIIFILIFLLGASLKEFIEIIKGIYTYEFHFDSHDIDSNNLLKKLSLNLLTTEFLFIISSLLLSVNLISIVRPFPIGWDDLGVYMNFGKLIAEANNIGVLGTIISWQTFTGIGYLFNSPTLAFFLNNVGGFMSFILLVLITGDLLKSNSEEKSKTLLNIPLLVSTIFISMPMIIFEQAKDMKLDPGLFFISIVALYLAFKVLLKYINHKDDNEFNHKNLYLYFLIIGILCGIAFTIKFTSLMLIIGIFGILFYSRFGINGFFGFLGIFIAIFTKFGLWEQMGVVYPKDNLELISNTSIASFLIGILFLAYAFHKNRSKLNHFLAYLSLIGLGILLAISPWLINNIGTNGGKVSVSTILSGKANFFNADYEKIYSKEEINLINKKQDEFNLMSSSGKTQNEDFGRYFGYENGINNYIKLPVNLTMQSNQNGEFTDITFIFLAIIPILLLFIPFRNKIYFILTIIFIGIELILILSTKDSFLTNLMGNISLPFGYIFILIQFILMTLIFTKNYKNNALNGLFKVNIIFSSIYIFLWTIAAFGVVWYGILMYFSFLLIISIGAFYISNYDEAENKKNLLVKLGGSLTLLSLISIYFFMSSIPHGFINLKTSSYDEFKTNKIGTNEAIFAYHPDYLKTLFEVNIKKEKQIDFLINSIESEEIKNVIKSNKYFDVSMVETFLKQIENDPKATTQIKIDAKNSRLKIYSGILSPKNEYKSDAIIYRLGTFLKYFISENNKRLFEDGLLNYFDLFIYNKDSSKTVENMKKLGLSYLLVDLNSATIDQDPRHDLTRRYEELLKTFTSDKLDLVETDSYCLQIGLEDYKKSKKTDDDMKNYIEMAGVNYESYDKDGNAIGRGIKINKCYNKILSLMQGKKIDENNYSYLIPLQRYLESPENKDLLKNYKELGNFFVQYVRPGYKALFIIK